MQYWTALGSIASMIGVIVAITVFIFNNRKSNFTKAIDILMQYDNKFDSPEFRAKRCLAAKFILNGSKKDDKDGQQALNDVLNFFEIIAFLFANKAINAAMVWHFFASWFLPYWKASEKYIKDSRLNDPTSYESSDKLFSAVSEIEKKRCFKNKNDFLCDVSLREFLEVEAEIPQY
jgi:hypothetical protein